MKVEYNSRTNVDPLIEKIRETGRYDQVTFAQKRDPCDGLFKKFRTAFQIPREPPPGFNNIQVTIAPDVPGMKVGQSGPEAPITSPHDTDNVKTGESPKKSSSRFKTLTAFTDTSGFKHLNPETLEPLGVATQSSLHPSLTGPFSAAHANFCPNTGDVLNHNCDFTLPSPTYRIWKTSRETEETEIVATIKDPDAACAYLHSSFITENFFILPIWSSHVAKGGIQVLWERNVLDAILPFPSDPAHHPHTVWLVIDRTGGRGMVAKFESPPGFSFHNSNAWEEKRPDGTTDLILDCVEYANLDIIHQFYYKNFMSSSAAAPLFRRDHAEGLVAHYRRYKLAGVLTTDTPELPLILKNAEVLLHHETPKVGEFPGINPLYHTKPNKYVYTATDTGKSSFFDSITKLNVETGGTQSFCIKHHTPGEPIFVPNPDGTEEDDGVILVVMFDGDNGTSYLACIDGKSMEEIGRAEVGSVVSFGFHGRHIGLDGQVSGPAAESG